ncbi:MAG: hypothetical protein JW817_02260, partial [Clostridiales bacterium]|nr:hypothetical protein [Clostridiales bacterium]
TITQVLYVDNPFVSEETIADAELDKRTDPAKYRHVWLGGLREKGRGMIFPDYQVIPAIEYTASFLFISEKRRRMYGPDLRSGIEREHGRGRIFSGLDVGHGESPTHAVLGWLSKERQRITIIDEYRGVGKSPNEIAEELARKLPILIERRIPLWVDAAALGIIMHLRQVGFVAQSAPKWSNSVLEGIDRIRSCELLICGNCPATISDFSRYSWELDANDQPTGSPEKRHDHAPDALRYGVHAWIRSNDQGYAPLSNPWI